MSNPTVYTVTLNPSLDRTLVIHHLAVGYLNRTREPARLDPAGRGVNIARALHHLECATHALVMLGDCATGRAYKALITEEGFQVTFIEIEGQTRSNTFILDTGNEAETHLIEDSSEVTPDDLEKVARKLKELVNPDDVVVFAGALPHGAPEDTYARLTEIAHEAGAEVTVVTEGETLRQALEAKPDLIMSSRQQAEAFFNFPVRLPEDVIACAHKFRELGADQVLLMADDVKAVLVTEEGQLEVELKSAGPWTHSGVWDAMLAGILAGHAKHKPFENGLVLGAEAAAYATTHPGKDYGTTEDIKGFEPDVDVHDAEQMLD